MKIRVWGLNSLKGVGGKGGTRHLDYSSYRVCMSCSQYKPVLGLGIMV